MIHSVGQRISLLVVPRDDSDHLSRRGPVGTPGVVESHAVEWHAEPADDPTFVGEALRSG